MKNIKGSIILLAAALIWGTAFVAQTSGSDNVPAFTFNAARSYIGALFLWLMHFAFDAYRQKSDSGYIPERWPVKGGIICGTVLFCAMGLQQIGIGLYPEGVAASGRSGFLTATYVVMVAVYSQFAGKKIHLLVAISVVGVICGMYLLCIAGGMTSLYIGDLLEFLCAVCFTTHILVIDRYPDCNSIKLSCIQLLACGTISLVFALITEHISIENIIAAIGPILFAGIMSSGVAYTLQMAGQKYAEPAVASIVMSLESVFSVLAGWLILGEILEVRELCGCALVFGSVIVAQIPRFGHNRAVE